MTCDKCGRRMGEHEAASWSSSDRLLVCENCERVAQWALDVEAHCPEGGLFFADVVPESHGVSEATVHRTNTIQTPSRNHDTRRLMAPRRRRP
jgi:hypothetical protein